MSRPCRLPGGSIRIISSDSCKLWAFTPKKISHQLSSSGFSVETFGFTPIRLEIGGHLPPKKSSMKNPHQTSGWNFSELLQNTSVKKSHMRQTYQASWCVRMGGGKIRLSRLRHVTGGQLSFTSYPHMKSPPMSWWEFSVLTKSLRKLWRVKHKTIEVFQRINIRTLPETLYTLPAFCFNKGFQRICPVTPWGGGEESRLFCTYEQA
ncbi:hypothetical protein CDAR_74281 [Caerostris darwini]|uniref:Uncharacterized protein n=1 Tax=Caerostris darwini TaxID=1538125 RepID=A0AAV4UJW1_9ARAC|nr:hypothetical protein CDAR_74281 [Caerostris darwini]